MEFHKRPLIITDLETTGLDCNNDDIIEIGAIKVHQYTLKELGRFEAKLYTNINVPEEVRKINGYNEDDWEENSFYPNFALSNFIDFSQDGILASWNIGFDYLFLNQAFKKYHLKDKMDYHRLDIPSMCWDRFKPISLKQDSISNGLMIEPESYPHRAINGAEQSLKILRKLNNLT